MRIHDRYVLGGFARNLLIGLLAFTVIYITVDISEETDNFYDHGATIREVASYYFYTLPWIVLLVMPVAVLLSSVFTLGRLSRENELTALISSGTPLVRIAAPILWAAFILSVSSIVLN